MTVIENVFICITAPILFAVICSRDRARRMMLFLLAGMSMCLLSSYISAFLAVAQGADMTLAQVEISPLVEEVMKFLPMLFYLLVFEPKGEEIAPYALMIGVGFRRIPLRPLRRLRAIRCLLRQSTRLLTA